MVVELHCHTSEHSACSHVNAVQLIKRAFAIGLQAVVITDHHYQWKDDELAGVKSRAGIPDFFHVLAGQEFKTSDYGDILVYGVKETIKKQPLTLEEVRQKYSDAAIIWAHPYRHNKIPEKEKLLNPLLDGIEIFSSNYNVLEAARALKDWHELKYTAIAGTDTHALSYTGSYPTIFDHPVTTIEGIVEELKQGRCRPYFKEVEKSGTSDTKVTEVTFGPKTSRKKIIVKTYEDIEGWKEGERSQYIAGEIYNNGFKGGKFRVSRPLQKDEKNLSLIEEHVNGETLYDKLLNANEEKAKEYIKMAAGWLAKLHNLQLKVTPDDEFLKIEKERLEYYLSGMYTHNHSHTKRAQDVLDEVWENEVEIFNSYPEILVQSHGDFHLKNIVVSIDEGSGEEYMTCIDFDSSYRLPRAFDAGTFIAQYRNMFFDKPEVTQKAPVELFLREYLEKSLNTNPDFGPQVQLYKARANLSIIYYLVKVGKGDSENFWTVLVDAERNLAHMKFKRTFKT
ncbi:MAG: phosphotransferase [Ignavibacteriaceae bacterium]